jgi:hypothetical protein
MPTAAPRASTTTSNSLDRGFSRYVVLINPVSTHAEQGKKRITELRHLYGDKRVHIIRTVAGGAAANQRLLVKHRDLLGPDTLLCIIAGDGTVNAMIDALVQGKGLSPSDQQTVILPLWGGNANDLANMLNGIVGNRPFDEIISQGRIIHIRPLACRLSCPGSADSVRIAACYISFGATALAADRLNRPTHRGRLLHRLPGGRLLGELHTGIKALVEAPPFRIYEHGTSARIYERTFANGPRFAKLDHFPAKLTEQKFYQHTITDKRLGAVLSRLAGAIRKPTATGHTPDNSTFTVLEETIVQFDGEPMTVKAGTTITVSLADTSFCVLSTAQDE